MRIRMNPDRKFANEVLQKIRDNGGYCPCKLEKTVENKCMCKEFLEMEGGTCHCGLYIKEENDE